MQVSVYKHFDELPQGDSATPADRQWRFAFRDNGMYRLFLATVLEPLALAVEEC